MIFFKYINALLPSRVNRIKYFVVYNIWLFLLIGTIAICALSSFHIIAITLAAITLIFTIINSFALKVKRLHDVNCSGWCLLIFLLPIIGIIFEIYISFARGTKGKNKFGPESKRSSKLEYILTPIFIVLDIVLITLHSITLHSITLHSIILSALSK
jgi:uncharacterized membrane protein YhaH (DUF805 family)